MNLFAENVCYSDTFVTIFFKKHYLLRSSAVRDFFREGLVNDMVSH